MNQENETESQEIGISIWTVLFLLILVGIWAYFYSVALFPSINNFILQHTHSYKAAIHVIPILGVPIAVWWVYIRLIKNER